MESMDKNDITQKPIAYLCVGRRADGTKCETTAFTAATAKIWPEANGFVSHYTVPLFAESRWIPVAERLPEPRMVVAVYVQGDAPADRSITVAHHWLGQWRSTYAGEEPLEEWCNVDGDVTHWMPLPAPPTDAK